MGAEWTLILIRYFRRERKGISDKRTNAVWTNISPGATVIRSGPMTRNLYGPFEHSAGEEVIPKRSYGKMYGLWERAGAPR